MFVAQGEDNIVARTGLDPGPLAYRASTLQLSYRTTRSSFDIVNMEGENVTGYRSGVSYTCSALRNKPAFIATW